MKNIRIAYALSFLWRSWFWLGIWIFYYLRFTDYAGIGFLEAVMITTATIGEIPTGAIADIVGKRTVIILAFAMGAIGNIVMAFAPNYWVLVASIVTMTLGGAFYSGSLEALVYDTLIENGNTDIYHKVISRMTTMQNFGMAVAGITGGFLYQINISLPFILVAFAYTVGLLLSTGLIEPKIDTEKYSWTKFLSQNKRGFNQLFSTKRIAFLTLLFLIPGAFMIATDNVLNDATALELGFTSVQLGIFVTILYLFGVFVSEQSTWIIKKLNSRWLYSTMLGLYIGTLLTMPKAGFLIGGILLLLRYGAATVFGNYESVRINAVIDSRYRATTLSTLSLMKNIPYVLGATSMGILMNIYTTKIFSFYFGLLALVCVTVLFLLKPLFRER